MAKNESTPNETDEIPTPEPAPVDVAALTKAVTDAEAKVAATMATFAEAAGDLPKMLAASKQLTLDNQALDRAKNALTAATWNLRNEERLEFAGIVKAAVEELIAGFDAKARELSLSGVHVSFGDEGTTVSITDKAKPVGKRTVNTRTPGTGTGKPRANVVYNGRSMSAREFLLEYGGDAGAEAVARAAKDGPLGWVAQGLKMGPGFDAAKKKLMRELGATFEDGSTPG